MRRIYERSNSGKRFGVFWLSTISVLLMLSCAFFVVATGTVSADQESDYAYTLSGDPAVATITGYIGAGGAISIPSILDGYDVVAIGINAFNSDNGHLVTSVSIPNSITSIGIQGFKSCTSLTSVTIPNSITSIGDLAFLYCAS